MTVGIFVTCSLSQMFLNWKIGERNCAGSLCAKFPCSSCRPFWWRLETMTENQRKTDGTFVYDHLPSELSWTCFPHDFQFFFCLTSVKLSEIICNTWGETTSHSCFLCKFLIMFERFHRYQQSSGNRGKNDAHRVRRTPPCAHFVLISRLNTTVSCCSSYWR